jgi:poly(A) polymerase/tRNA nucleotidyltransferase (CCA-adding enzyme)
MMIDTHSIKKKLYPQIFDICNLITNYNFCVYIVGGTIRNILLDKKSTLDVDIATDATPEDLKKNFPDAIAFGEKFGTIMVKRGNLNFEITTFRSEDSYKDLRHPDKIRFIKDIHQDLARRDFTINALAYDIKNDVLLDDFDGIHDLQRGIIKCVGDPESRFKEDALRLIRACRFASVLGFTIEKNTLISITNNSDLLTSVSMERIRDEFMKILESEVPSKGINLLKDTGLLIHIIPELIDCISVEQNKYHSLDVYDHSVLSCDKADIKVRLVALLHDIGKPKTKDGEHFYGHEIVGAQMAEVILDRLKFSRSYVDIVKKLISLHLFNYTPEWTDAAVRRFMRKVGDDNMLELLFLLRFADERGNPKSTYDFSNINDLKNRIEDIMERDEAISIKDLKINGNDIIKLGYVPGPDIGKVLNYLLEKVLDDPSLNNKDKLINLVKCYNN